MKECDETNLILTDRVFAEYFKLNEEVEIIEEEIIEEESEIKKIEVYEDSDGSYFYDKHCHKIYITCDEINFMFEQFNELIGEVNELKKTKEVA